MPGTELWGDWHGALERVRAWPGELRRRLEQTTERIAVDLVGKVKKGIVDQAPGGKAFAPLHPFTVRMRAVGTSARGAKALIHHGDLLGAITYVLGSDRLSATIGVLRTAKGRDGESLVNVARVLSEGRVIRVTERMRKFLHWRGLHLKSTTTHVIIPPRPFIEPVFEKEKATIRERFRAAVLGR